MTNCTGSFLDENNILGTESVFEEVHMVAKNNKIILENCRKRRKNLNEA